jgi:hypothetical protein
MRFLGRSEESAMHIPQLCKAGLRAGTLSPYAAYFLMR